MGLTQEVLTTLEETLRGMLEPDGFSATVDRRSMDERLTIEVRATDAACADCLVPKEVLLMVLHELLPPDIGELEIIYPAAER